jgi:hypothetical protein
MRPTLTIVMLVIVTAAAVAQHGSKQGAVSGDTPPPVPKITVTSSLADDFVREQSHVYFTGLIVNEGTVTVSAISVLASPPDTVRFIQRLPIRGTESCDGPDIQTTLLGDLPPGGREAFCGTLDASQSHPKRRVTLVVHYAYGKVSYDTTTSPGLLSVQDWSDHWSTKLYDLLKDFTFPIVLALFGVILKFITDKRELRSETWKEMLPQSHELASKYYMPLAGAALGMSVEWKRYVDKPSEQGEAARQMFYYILNFGRVLRDMRYAIGGFYFKDRIGERIAGRCWKELRDVYFPTTNEDKKLNYFRALRLVGKKQDVDLLLDNLDAAGPASPMRKAWEDFNTLLSNPARFKEMIAYFDLVRAVISYESNRVYAYWYRLPENLRLEDEQKTQVYTLFPDETDKEKARLYFKLSAKGQ